MLVEFIPFSDCLETNPITCCENRCAGKAIESETVRGSTDLFEVSHD